MEHPDVQAPADVPADLTAPDVRYRILVAVVLGCLAVFVVFYIGLGLLCVDQLRLSWSLVGSDSTFVAVLAALPAACLLILLLSGLWGIERMDFGELHEVTAEEQPTLFRFVYGIADEVKAPRPKRILISREVNAAVAYDTSILNLVLPTQKNLIIGLGLVNALTLDEFKAVLAHEFGHFSQSSMRLGSYVYVANRVIARLVNHRGPLDTLVSFVSHFDLRVAWVGWLVALLMWAVRTVLESMFFVLNLPYRALGREMEFHADKVAVSLTGSDSLVRGLFRLGFATAALNEAYGEIAERARSNRYVHDLFAHQTTAMENLRHRASNPMLGAPSEDVEHPATHRVFEGDDAPPPQMWSTHPPNPDREESAKTPYLPSHLDERSAWVVFDAADLLREAVTAEFNREAFSMPEDAVVERDTEVGLGMVGLEPRYRGLYSVLRLALYSPDPDSMVSVLSDQSEHALLEAAALLYGDELAALVRRRGDLYSGFHKLYGVCAGDRVPSEGFSHGGALLRLTEVRAAAQTVRASIVEVDRALDIEGKRIRGVVRAMALGLGEGWATRHADALRWLHFTEHTAEALDGIRAGFEHLMQFAIETELSAQDLQGVLDDLYRLWEDFGAVLARLDEAEVYSGALPEGVDSAGSVVLDEPRVESPSVAAWEVLWVQAFVGQLERALQGSGDLRRGALDHLLAFEDTVLKSWPDAADVEPLGPMDLPRYPTFERIAGAELAGVVIPEPPSQRRDFGGWAKTGGTATVAVALLVALGGARLYLGAYELVLYNGGVKPVVAVVDGDRIPLLGSARRSVTFYWPREISLGAEIDGVSIRPTLAVLGAAGETQGIFNVGGRGLFADVEQTWSEHGDAAARRDPVLIGNPAFLPVTTDYAFDGPDTISTDTTAYRSVLMAVDGVLDTHDEFQWLGNVHPDQLASHAEAVFRQDTLSAAMVQEALVYLPLEKLPEIADRLLADAPGDVEAKRLVQIAHAKDPDLVATYAARAEASPTADSLYLYGRAVTDLESALEIYERALALQQDHLRATCARADVLAGLARFQEALEGMETCRGLDVQAGKSMFQRHFLVARAAGVDGDGIQALLAGSDREDLVAWVDAERGLPSNAAEVEPGLLLVAGRPLEALTLVEGEQDETSILLRSLISASDAVPLEVRTRLLDSAPVSGADPQALLWYAVAADLADHPSAEARRAALVGTYAQLAPILDGDPLSGLALELRWQGLAIRALKGERDLRELARRLNMPGTIPWMAP